MPNTIKNILFDLDGTLTNPKLGITSSIRYALKKMSQPVPESDELLWCIGPPLIESFKKLLGQDPEAAAAAISYYRQRFSKTGMFENEVYPDIPLVLDSLNQKGFTLLVATSKPQVYAKPILEHFNLDHCFRKIYGSTLAGDWIHKDQLIPHILTQEKLSIQQTIMVGDREHDIIGAKRSGIRSIGVTYGFGTKAELVAAGADAIVGSATQILETLENL